MDIYSQVLILFALVGTGYLCKRYRIISNKMNEDLGNLILLVSMPALIIQSMSTFSYSAEMMREIAMMVGISLGLYLFYVLVSYLFPRILGLRGAERDIVQFITVFANTGFMGFPISYIFFGNKGLLYMVILNMFYDLFVWTFGISILGRPRRSAHEADAGFRPSQLKGLLNPCIIAVFIGLALIVSGLELPGPVLGFLDMLGKIATPLAMIFVGSMLADLKFSHIFTDRTIIKASIFKLIVLPLLVMGILKALGIAGLFVSIAVLATAMPAAASTTILAGKYGNDQYFASKIVFMSTLFSILTIPLMVTFL